MLVLGVVGGVFYLWMGLALLILLWIPVSFYGFRRRGTFMVMPATGMGRNVRGSSRQVLYVFTAVRVVLIIILIVAALGAIHTRGH